MYNNMINPKDPEGQRRKRIRENKWEAAQGRFAMVLFSLGFYNELYSGQSLPQQALKTLDWLGLHDDMSQCTFFVTCLTLFSFVTVYDLFKPVKDEYE